MDSLRQLLQLVRDADPRLRTSLGGPGLPLEDLYGLVDLWTPNFRSRVPLSADRARILECRKAGDTLGAYANNGHENGDGWSFTGEYPPDRYLEEAQGWVALGVQLIGGCCGTMPEHIRALRDGLPDRLPGR